MKICKICLQRVAIGIDTSLPGGIIIQTIRECLKMGVPFLPLDLSNSSWRTWVSRIAFCIELHHNQPVSTLTLEVNPVEQLQEEPNRTHLHVGEGSKHPDGDSLKRDDILYIVTTSGTSKPDPKIVYVTRSSVEPNINDFRLMMGITPESVLYCTSPLTFDPAILTILISINSTASVVMDAGNTNNPSELLKYLRWKRVTHIQAVPSFLKLMQLDTIARVFLAENNDLKVISMGGEQCLTGAEINAMCGGSDAIIDRLRFFNVYGLTEQSVWSSIYEIDHQYIKSKNADVVPIGEALTDTQLTLGNTLGSGMYELVLDSDTRLCFIDDLSGNLLTSYKFHTGDLVSQSESQTYFEGRKYLDFVNIGGCRVNLQFVSRKVEEMDGVCQAHCSWDRRSGLVLIYTGVCKTADIKQHLSTTLPPVYVPSCVIKVDKFPVNSHGKLDRKILLHTIDCKLRSADCTSNVASLIQAIIPTVNFDKTFIENGGSSIQALALSNQLLESLRMKPDMEHRVLQVILNDNIRDLIAHLESGDLSPTSTKEPLSIDNYAPQSKRLKADHSEVDGVVPLLLGVVVKGNAGSPPPSLSGTITALSCLWNTDSGKCVDATPLIVTTSMGVLAYIGSHSHRFLCIKVADGEVLWSITLGGRIESTATMSLTHGIVFVAWGFILFKGCYDRNLYCVNAMTGVVIYKHITGDVIKSTPAIHGNLLYFGSHDQHLYCLNMVELVLVWKMKLDGAVYTTPILRDDIYVYITTLAGSIYRLKAEDGDIIESVTLDSPIFSTPCSSSSGILICTVGGTLTCREYTNLSKVVWSFQADGNVFSTPVIIEDLDCVIFGCHDKRVYCLDMATQSVLWRVLCDSPVGCSPFPYKVNTAVYVLVISTKGTVYSVDSSSGDCTQLYTLPGEVFGSPIIVENKIVLGCRDDKIYCFRIT